ncbi:MAG: hypothetical protein H0X38_07300 [Planctomycetes bacterium]|nr:hypothetical protein [Planctomycetota bacterium]
MRVLLTAMVLLLLAGRCALGAAEGSGPWTLRKNGAVTVVTLERAPDGAATLVAVITPEPPTDGRTPGHLYSIDLKSTTGKPSLLELKAGGPAKATGPLTADQPVHMIKGVDEDLPVYPEGPVTLRLPIQLPAGPAGQTVDVVAVIGYMVCGSDYCLNPVKALLTITLPTVPVASGTPAVAAVTAAVDPAVLRDAVRVELLAARAAEGDALRTIVADELVKAQAGRIIRWRRPATVAEAERFIAEAQQAGMAALLDFTGPSCVNCQDMAKTVFRDPRVIAGWNNAVPIEIDTDPPNDALAQWEQDRFKTQSRPLYVRLEAAPKGGQAGTGGAETRWSEVFDPRNSVAMERFLAFLGGGTGSDAGGGSGVGQFILLALLGGLFTLVMPCTYPMIPFTLNFFAKQAAGGRRLVPLAAFYAFGIIACFVGLGVLITGVFGSTLATVSGHPVTNLVIALLFTVLGLSLLGAFFLRLPAALEGQLGGSRGGYLGALIMGLTFAVTAFTCTAPFAGSVLAQAVATGSWVRAMLGMAVYASAIALPFFVLAISPGALSRLPRAGAWMNEFKVVGGLVELAAALKFLAICDNAWGWGVVGRTLTIAVWAAVALLIAFYVLGKVRMAGDTPVAEAGVGRTLLAIIFLALGLWLAAGLAGHNLGVLESFFPADAAP